MFRKTNDLNNPFSVLVADSQDWISNPGVDAPPPTTLFLCSLSLVAESMSSENNLSLNNYYDRFLTAFDITDDGLKKRIKTNFKSTEKLWIDLNEWLTRHGGALGIPTAKPIMPTKQFISYPISQALIRSGDKKISKISARTWI